MRDTLTGRESGMPRVFEQRARYDTDPYSSPVQAFVGERQQRIALAIVAVGAFLAAAWIASSIWAGLLLGLLTAFALEKPHSYVKRVFKKSPGLAAAATTTGITVVVLSVLSGLALLIGSQLLSAVRSAQELFPRMAATGLLGEKLTTKLASIGVTQSVIDARLANVADHVAEFASSSSVVILGQTFNAILGSIIGVVTVFYVLKDRRPIERRLQRLLPLNPRTTKELVDEFRMVGRGTLVGSVFTALVQGTLAGIGFAIAGVPRALLLGALTAVASFVPVLGTLAIWIPAGAYLIVRGDVGAGAFDLIWGAFVVVALSDYVIRPLLVGRESHSHPLLLLVGFIGGVEVFGGVGIIAGPIIMAFFASVLRIYRREIVDVAHGTAGLSFLDHDPANEEAPR